MKIEVSIITINYNGLKDTCELIESIPFNENLEVIVVDNASQNQEADIISQKFPHVKVIRSEKNLGFAGGNNLGIKAAQGRYLFLVNNDTIFKDFNIQGDIFFPFLGDIINGLLKAFDIFCAVAMNKLLECGVLLRLALLVHPCKSMCEDIICP